MESVVLVVHGLITNISQDQQLGQMYELMQAIRKREIEDSELDR